MLLLNHRTAPELPVVYAVRMSMSVPLLWEEVVWRRPSGAPTTRGTRRREQLTPNDMTGHEIVDGGLLSNFPIALLHGQPRPMSPAVMGEPKAKNVLGLLIDETLPVPNRPARPATQRRSGVRLVGGLSVVRSGCSQLANTATCAHDNMAKAVFAANVVRLPAGGYTTTQFDMTDAEREALIDAGRERDARVPVDADRARRRGQRARPVVGPAIQAAANAAAATILQ